MIIIQVDMILINREVNSGSIVNNGDSDFIVDRKIFSFRFATLYCSMYKSIIYVGKAEVTALLHASNPQIIECKIL